MAHAEVLRITYSIRNEVKIVDGKVERVEDKIECVGDKVGDKVEDVGDKVQCVDDKVQVVIDGARGLSSQLKDRSNVYIFRRQTSKSGGEGHR
jgi:hypothetical protein